MIGAFNFETVAVIDPARDLEDHGVVEEVGAGKTKAMVTVGLGEVGILLVIVRMVHIILNLKVGLL